MRSRQITIALVAAAALAAATACAWAANDPRDWQPAALVALLLVLAVVSDAISFEIRGLRLSGAFLALVLAMALLGPAPAAAIGVVSALVDALVSRRSLDRALVNVATYAVFPLVGGLAIEFLV